MVAPNIKLAQSLKVLKAAQDKGRSVFRSKDMTRIHRERLVQNGWLTEVVKGWYIAAKPGEGSGESTAWYASFFEFVAQYCEARFGKNWHLSPEASLLQYAGNTIVPKQMLIYAKKGSNNNLALKFETSIFDYEAKAFKLAGIQLASNGLRLLSLPETLVQVSPALFVDKPLDMRVAISQVRDASEVLEPLLAGGQPVVAGRLAGAFRAVGRAAEADRIVAAMKTAGYTVHETNPFTDKIPLLATRHEHPCVARIRLMWASMRELVLQAMPAAPGLVANKAAYIADVNDRHVEDAYHSLSIEGYRVSEALIAKIAAGSWDPEESERDKTDKDALAAKGYHDAFQRVRASVERILEAEESGGVVRQDHHDWYLQLFGPMVRAGILETRNLAGYRSWPIYIRNARYVPPSSDAAREAMPAFFELLINEPEPAVRAVLGHYVFVYIHPYGDGNGRMGRFLMNTMLAAGGYPWTVVRVEDRAAYRQALDQASVDGNIVPFAQFIAMCVSRQMSSTRFSEQS